MPHRMSIMRKGLQIAAIFIIFVFQFYRMEVGLTKLQFYFMGSRYEMSYSAKYRIDSSGKKNNQMICYYVSFEDASVPGYIFKDELIFIRDEKSNNIMFPSHYDHKLMLSLSMAVAIVAHNVSL